MGIMIKKIQDGGGPLFSDAIQKMDMGMGMGMESGMGMGMGEEGFDPMEQMSRLEELRVNNPEGFAEMLRGLYHTA
jgi:hypothetical protein